MKIEELLQLYALSPQVEALAATLGKKSVKTVFLEGLMCSSAPMLFCALKAKCPATVLFVLQDADEAGYFYHDMVQLLDEGQVLFFPSSYRRAVKYGQRDAANEILRTEVLAKLNTGAEDAKHSTQNAKLYIVTYPEAISELVVSKRQLNERLMVLRQDDTVEVDRTADGLRELGFREVDYVYEPGQFALRGSILDVYSYSSELPFRIDFFGDDIDSIRTFEVETQLSKDRRDVAEIVPEVSTASEKVPFLSFLADGTLLVAKDWLYVRDAVDRTYQEGFSQQALQERMEGATEQEQHDLMQAMRKEQQLVSGQQLSADMQRFRRIEMGSHPTGVPQATLTFHTAPQPQFHKNFELLQQSLEDSLSRGYRLYILADSAKQLERLRDIFAEKDTVRFEPVEKTLHEGFVDHDLKLCVFTDHQMFDRFHKYNLRSDKARSGKVALTLKEIQQFETGDYVVHIDHGIGKFGGLVRMPVASPAGGGQEDAYQEMIKIIYDGGGTIYVSIHSLYKVSKYKAQDGGEAPRLSHLGTGQWERMKERTKQKLKDIARDLIKLYAARRQQKGFAFSADSFMQHELEASFLYEDTPDQLKATTDVKADMERPQPMDRLVCGDVGFGKTEVAVRAAFKAACDSKQVAVLVPTTVLAYQHFQTFSGRLKDLPVRVEYLSRARSTKQTTAILKDLADGKIDIIIGTHKLIGKSVKFKDLGLLIIDEEQKFGVSTKEKLRQLKTNVDTLTMSATPIPRTLQFSLVGARDLSIIQTPPPNRYPIQTEIHTFSSDIIADAVNFEMSRNGQVYFVNPRINGAQNFGLSDLHQMRGRVGRGNRKAFCYLLAPPLADLPVEGRRRLEALEQFSDLGSGIHIAMQDLDIRGAGNLLGAEQSGFIADLGYETYVKILNQAVVELRNEGGDRTEKGGERNVQGQKNGRASVSPSSLLPSPSSEYVTDCSLESDLEMYFPDQYVPSDSERMLLYRELDGLHTDEQLEAYRKRLVDRFGPVPQCGEELMRVVPLRRLGKSLGCEKVVLRQQRMTMHFVSNADSPFYQSEAFDRLLSFVARNPRRCQFREQNGKRQMVIANIPTVEEAVSLLLTI